MLDEWASLIEPLRAAPLPEPAKGFRSVGRLIFGDSSVHEHDIRGALNRPAPDNETVLQGVRHCVEVFGSLLRRPQKSGLAPVVRLTATGVDSWVIEQEGAVGEVALEAPAFEISARHERPPLSGAGGRAAMGGRPHRDPPVLEPSRPPSIRPADRLLTRS